MNPELLKKCLSGNASDSEWEKYLIWMSGNSTDEELEGVIPADASVKLRAWEDISRKNRQADQKRRNRRLTLFSGVAASILCICYFSFLAVHDTTYQSEGTFSYNSHADEHNDFNGITVKLAKDSRVNMQQVEPTDIDLHFTGSVMLSNTTGEDRYIDVRSGTAGGVKKMCLRKGHSYLLSHFNFKFEEVIMVDKQSLLDLPPALAMNIQQKFDL